MKSGENKLEVVVLLLVGLAMGIMYSAYNRSANELYQVYDVPLQALDVPEGVAAVEEGERLALFLGDRFGQFGLTAPANVFIVGVPRAAIGAIHRMLLQSYMVEAW